MTDVLVYASASRAQTARAVLGAACQATGIGARLELYGTGALYQRLGPRHAQPLPDLIMWFGPFAAQAAALDGLLQPHQPARVADSAPHDAGWYWSTLDYLSVGVIGPSAPGGLQDLAPVRSLAVADPERSEAGMAILLSTLDRARQVDGDVERGWAWWQQRARSGLVLIEDDRDAPATVRDGDASHALSLLETALPVTGLAPIPNAIGLAASARNVDAARRLLDWLTSESVGGMLRFSPWQAASTGLQALLSAAPVLDVEWCRQQYSATRRRWGQSGFGPLLKG